MPSGGNLTIVALTSPLRLCSQCSCWPHHFSRCQVPPVYRLSARLRHSSFDARSSHLSKSRRSTGSRHGRCSLHISAAKYRPSTGSLPVCATRLVMFAPHISASTARLPAVGAAAPFFSHMSRLSPPAPASSVRVMGSGCFHKSRPRSGLTLSSS